MKRYSQVLQVSYLFSKKVKRVLYVSVRMLMQSRIHTVFMLMLVGLADVHVRQC